MHGFTNSHYLWLNRCPKYTHTEHFSCEKVTATANHITGFTFRRSVYEGTALKGAVLREDLSLSTT